MRKWKTILWIAVLSFLSVSCGTQTYDPTQQYVGNPNGYPTGYPTGYPSGYTPPTQQPTGYPTVSGGTGLPVVYGADGVYLGSLTAAGTDPESLCYPGNEFGSMQSQTSIWNYYSAYGSPTSPLSVSNPAAQTPPTVCYWDGVNVTNCFAFISTNVSLGYQTYSPATIRQSVCGY